MMSSHLCIPLFSRAVECKIALLYYKIEDPAWRLMAAKMVYDFKKKKIYFEKWSEHLLNSDTNYIPQSSFK